MKGPKELRRYINLLRSLKGKKNGVIPGYAFDDLHIFKLDKCKKWSKDIYKW